MTALPPNDKQLPLSKARKRSFFRQLTRYDGQNLTRILREIETMLQEASLAVDEIQELQVASREVDPSGKPANEARCEAFDGQFIRILQYDPSPVYITVNHGLGRVPQGAVPVLSSAATNRAYVEGDPFLNIKPADDRTITFALFGNIGDDHTFILF